MFFHTWFVSYVKKEGLISTTRNKLFILPSLRLLTLVGYISLIIGLVVGGKTCGNLYPYFRQWRKPMALMCHGLFVVLFHSMPFRSRFRL